MEAIDFGWIVGAMASRARSQAPHAGASCEAWQRAR
jgi:hypothetical protein